MPISSVNQQPYNAQNLKHVNYKQLKADTSAPNFKEQKNDELILLENSYKEAQNEQGILGKFWNNFKNFTGLGHSTKDVDKEIEKYKNGEISCEEAQNSINSFKNKQKGAVNLFSNIISGAAAALVTASAVATGGISIGLIGLGALVSGAGKAGIKTLDRATNKVEGDALEAKEIAKDALSGAIDGAISTATAGMVKPITQSSQIAGKTLMQTAKTGAIQGAKAGAITGAATGGGDYTIEAIFEKDIEFETDELLKNVFQTAFFGGLTGGALGGISTGVQYKKVYNTTMNELSDTADILAQKYAQNIDSVKAQYDADFQDLSSVNKTSARAKSNETDSVFYKLKSNFDKGKLKTTDFDSCANVIGDGYGIKITLNNLDSSKARQIVEETLASTNKTYDDFIKALNNNDELCDEFSLALSKLKSAQTDEIVDRIVNLIDDNRLILANDEFNNYGNRLSSYFTDEQLEKIAIAYNAKTGKPLDLVSNCEFSAKASKIVLDDAKNPIAQKAEIVNFSKEATKKADRATGYTTAQGNTQSTYTTGKPLCDTEIQIRGVEVEDFAQLEHELYDIRQGKIKPDNPKYKDIYQTIAKMSDKNFKECNKFLKDTYKYIRLKELGISVDKPVLSVTKNEKLAEILSNLIKFDE